MSIAVVDETSGRNYHGPRLQSPKNISKCKIGSAPLLAISQLIRGEVAVWYATILSRKLIGRMTQMQGLHPFHYKGYIIYGQQIFQSVQNTPLDSKPRTLFKSILWSYKAIFSRGKAFNSHSTHFWSLENASDQNY
ncbi:hypothetical protein YQE_12433, partial [Dendroctonus ponderosae]